MTRCKQVDLQHSPRIELSHASPRYFQPAMKIHEKPYRKNGGSNWGIKSVTHNDKNSSHKVPDTIAVDTNDTSDGYD